MIITNSRYALIGYSITSYPTPAHGIIVIYLLLSFSDASLNSVFFQMKERLARDQGLVLLAQFSIFFCFENKPLVRTSLFTTFCDCGVIEGSFAWTEMSLSNFDFSFL